VEDSDLINDTRLSDIEKRHRNWQLPDLSNFTPEVAAFLTSCLQVDPKKRSVDLAEIARW
jgi:hypothetical protein